MPMEIEEITKLFDFILENKSLLEEGIFNIDTLVQLRAIMRDKQENDFLLNANQKQSLIDYFGKSNLYFTEDTPKIFLENEECIKKAVERSWNSVNFIKNITTNIEKFIVEQCKKKRYILKNDSPRFLKGNAQIISTKSAALNNSGTAIIDESAKLSGGVRTDESNGVVSN